jgi:carbonic anhydrase/acetyltransferase-like protein (isoleucine patch superfamily)
MATIVKLDGVRPTVGDGVWLAPTAVLVGDVDVGDRASIWSAPSCAVTAPRSRSAPARCRTMR